MQPNRSQLQKVIEIIQNATSALICIPDSPTPDAVASACALYLGLMQTGKNTSIACSSPVQSTLLGADKIQSEMATSGDNLVISFPYTDGSVDKVDYYIQNDRFNIVVTPRAGTERLNPAGVKFDYTGGTVDVVITIDTPNLRALGQIYTDNQELFKGKKIVNIDRHLTNSFYGTANYVNRTVSSTAELILGILQSINVPIDRDIATNLYAGIAAATNNYTSQTVNAGTFEASAYLLKIGAGAKKAPAQPAARAQSPDSPIQQPVQAPVATPFTQPMQQIQQAPSFERANRVRTPSAMERDRAASAIEGNDQDEEDEQWLKPKIFKSQGGEN